MTLQEAIKIVQDYQDYRRGRGEYFQSDEDVNIIPPKHTSQQYGEAIDYVLNIAIQEAK
jgi:hypothetical protein